MLGTVNGLPVGFMQTGNASNPHVHTMSACQQLQDYTERHNVLNFSCFASSPSSTEAVIEGVSNECSTGKKLCNIGGDSTVNIPQMLLSNNALHSG